MELKSGKVLSTVEIATTKVVRKVLKTRVPRPVAGKAAVVRNGGKGGGKAIAPKQKKEIECIICKDNFDDLVEDEFSGITCLRGCHFCSTRTFDEVEETNDHSDDESDEVKEIDENDCAGRLVRQIFFEQKSLSSLLCQCGAKIIRSTFERHLSKKQNKQYLSRLVVKSDEKIQHCIGENCKNYQVWPKEYNGIHIMQCKKEEFGCGAVFCTVCLQTAIVPYAEVEALDDEEYEARLLDPHCADFHNKCGDLGPDKLKIETAILSGCGATCPRCGVSGRKDDACTHITCSECRAYFCYVCEVAYKDLDKACVRKNKRRVINMSRHNEGWQTNPLRCPLYLVDIWEQDHDQRYKEDDEDNLAVLSHIRTLQLLRKTILDFGTARWQQTGTGGQATDSQRAALGVERFRLLQSEYASVRNCGFSIEEIMSADLTLIHRQTVEQYLAAAIAREATAEREEVEQVEETLAEDAEATVVSEVAADAMEGCEQASDGDFSDCDCDSIVSTDRLVPMVMRPSVPAYPPMTPYPALNTMQQTDLADKTTGTRQVPIDLMGEMSTRLSQVKVSHPAAPIIVDDVEGESEWWELFAHLLDYCNMYGNFDISREHCLVDYRGGLVRLGRWLEDLHGRLDALPPQMRHAVQKLEARGLWSAAAPVTVMTSGDLKPTSDESSSHVHTSVGVKRLRITSVVASGDELHDGSVKRPCTDLAGEGEGIQQLC